MRVPMESHTDPGHPYPPAHKRGNLIAVSGRLGVKKGEPSTIVEGGFEAEAKASLENVRAALQSVGADLDQVIQIVVYLTDISDRDALNRIYADFLGEARPARSCVGVASLPYGGCVEIEALAVAED